MTKGNDKIKPGLVNQVIQQKVEKVDQVVEPKLDKITARQEAYKRIVESVKQDLKDYYSKHPERAMDDRSKDAEDANLAGLRKIFNILDEYVISFPPPPVEPTPEHTT